MWTLVKYSNTWKLDFWPIFPHAQSALGPSESTLRHPKTASKPCLTTIAVTQLKYSLFVATLPSMKSSRAVPTEKSSKNTISDFHKVLKWAILGPSESTFQQPKSISNLHLSTNALDRLKYSLLLATWPSMKSFRALWTEKHPKIPFFSFWQKCQNCLAWSSQKWHSWSQKCYLYQTSPQTLLVDVITYY